MKAIIVHEGRPDPILRWEETSDVELGADEVLVDVAATAVNRADLSQARGHYPPPPGASEILGLEMAGTVAAVGEAVRGWLPGDRVCGLLPGGGYAQQAAVHQEMLLRLPDDWSFAEGAAVPEVWYTAFVNLFLEAELAAGENALIHAGGSGVGTAAIQLAQAAGARVFATAGAPQKLARCRELGAELAINYKEASFYEVIAAVADGVDVILDPVGAGYLADNLRLLRPNGRLVHIGTLSGATAEIDLRQVLGKSLRMIGSRLRPRPLAEKVAITRQFREKVWPQLVEGRFQPVIDCIFPIAEAGDAHAHVRQNRNTGKVILAVTADDESSATTH